MSSPGQLSTSAHQRVCLSKAHAQRLASGRTESHPSDYEQLSNERLRQLGAARRAIEDRRIARELEIT